MANPEGLFVEFYEDAHEDAYRSEQEGRPVYEQREFVRIIVPGDMNNIVERVASDEDKRRFPNEYARFKQGATKQLEGTLLTMWPPINKAQVKEAAYFEVHTVEQLAGLSDSAVLRMGMGWQEMRRKASAWLQAAADGAVVSKQAGEIEELQNTVKLLQEQLAQVNTARGPGRPRKEAVEA